jgi:hypothetical protein
MKFFLNVPALLFCLTAIPVYATLGAPQEDKESVDTLRELQPMRVDTTRFAVGVEMSNAVDSAFANTLRQLINSQIQLYIVRKWNTSYSTQPIVSTTKNSVRLLEEESEIEIYEEDETERSLQSFTCKLSYCQVIGCNNCPRRRRDRELQSRILPSCYPRIKDLETAIRDNINQFANTGVFGGTVKNVFAIEVPSGSPLVQLSSAEVCP